MLYIEPPFKGDRSEGLPIENRCFPIENPLVVVESVDFRLFLDCLGYLGLGLNRKTLGEFRPY